MSRENVTNFANTVLTSAIANTNTTPSFTVTTGTGANFPTVDPVFNPRWIIVCVDTEFIVCSARAGDTFTIASRGYEGTALASHAIGAPVSIAITAGMLSRVWQNLPDSYNLDVPPYVRAGITPSTWDDEFEGNSGLWFIYPTTGCTYDFGTTYPSHFSFERTDGNNSIYWVYKPFVPGTGAWQVTARLHHGATFGLGNNSLLAAGLFVCDQGNPTGSSDAGNLVRLDSNYQANKFLTYSDSGTTVNMPVRTASASYSIAGTWRLGASRLMFDHQYLRISYNGTGTIAYWLGDGRVWQRFYERSMTLNLTSGVVGFRFYAVNSAGVNPSEQVLVDWIRVDLGVSFNA